MSSYNSSPQDEFVRLFASHQQRIYSFIITLFPDRVLAEDVMQNTAVVMWRKFDTFEPGTNFLAWAFRIARFEVLNQIRQQKQGRLIFDEIICKEIANDLAQNTAIVSQRSEALKTCVEKLSDKDRDLIRRRYEDGVTTKQVAEAVGRPIEGMYKAMQRIHHFLFECVNQTCAKQSEEKA